MPDTAMMSRKSADRESTAICSHPNSGPSMRASVFAGAPASTLIDGAATAAAAAVTAVNATHTLLRSGAMNNAPVSSARAKSR